MSRRRISMEEAERLAGTSPPTNGAGGSRQSNGVPKSPPKGPASPDVVEQARRYLAQVPPAVEGQGGSNATFKAAAVLVVDFALTQEEAWPLLEEWNRGCQPPWAEADLRRKLEEADRRGKGERGSKRRPSAGQDRETTAVPPAADEPWEPPLPLGEWPVPEFPVASLPDWVREWVLAVADATQTPPDLAGVLALAILGAGGARTFRVLARPGWSEPTNLYAVTALPPGNRKSAVFAEALAPVEEFERDERETAAPRIAEAASARRTLEGRLRAAEQAVVRAGDDGERGIAEADAKRLARELAATPEPHVPQLWADDVTPERLAGLLADQGGRMLVASAEAAVFEIALGRYSESRPNVEVFLKGHAGDTLRVNRTGRPADEIERPALSMALTVQPAVVADLGESAHLAGRGFLARFLYAVPRSLVGSRAIGRPGVPAEVARRYRDGVRAVWSARPGVDECGRPAPRWLRLSPSAEAVLRRFETDLEPRLAEDGDLAAITEWGSKLAGAAVRIAGVLHLAAGADVGGFSDEVPAATMRAAVVLARDYFLSHALAAFGLMATNAEATRATRLLRWLTRKTLAQNSQNSQNPPKDGFVSSVSFAQGGAAPTLTKRAVFIGTRSTFKQVDALEASLSFLAKHGYLREVTPPSRPQGGRPSPTIAVNPVWLSSPEAEVFAGVLREGVAGSVSPSGAHETPSSGGGSVRASDEHETQEPLAQNPPSDAPDDMVAF